MLRIRIPIIFQDPDWDLFPGVLGCGSVSYSNEHNKINWKGKFNKVASVWVLLDLLTRKIKFRCIKSTVLGTVYYLFETVRIRIRIKLKSRVRIRIKEKSRIRIRRVWISNTALIGVGGGVGGGGGGLVDIHTPADKRNTVICFEL